MEYQFPDFSRYRAVISATGKVLWEPAGVFETSCIIDITFYPYDTQVCRADTVTSTLHNVECNDAAGRNMLTTRDNRLHVRNFTSVIKLFGEEAMRGLLV